MKQKNNLMKVCGIAKDVNSLLTQQSSSYIKNHESHLQQKNPHAGSTHYGD